MSGDILKRYAARNSGEASQEADAGDAEDAENLGCFGLLRGVRDRAICVELRQKSGRVLALNLAFVGKFEYDPADGVQIHYGEKTIVIKGRNLNSETRAGVRLFQALTRFRVPWIAEMDRAAAMQAAKDAVIVESIEW